MNMNHPPPRPLRPPGGDGPLAEETSTWSSAEQRLDVASIEALVADARAMCDAPIDARTDDRALESLAAQLEALRRATDALTAAVNGEMDARGSTDREHGHSTRTWTAATFQIPSDAAARRIKVARLLRQCPLLADALAIGQIGFDHVRVIASATNDRNLAIVVEIQQQLIDLTDEVLLFRYWAAKVVDLLRIADQDGPEPRIEDTHVHLDRQFDGTSRLAGTLAGETADVVKHALDTFADRLFHRFASDAVRAPGDLEIPHRSTLLGLALAETCRTALAATHTGPGTAADVTYVIHAKDPATVWSSDGTRVDSHTAQVACCDGAFHAVVMDDFGVPIDLGREARFASRGQRRTAQQRDGGCVFPGCDARGGHTDLHHVQHWEHGGRTDLGNLACLCRHHHGVVHRSGWVMRTVDHQRFEFTTPSGRTLMSQRHGAALSDAA